MRGRSAAGLAPHPTKKPRGYTQRRNMRKPKLILKIDRNNRAKLYFNGKWHQKDVVKLDLHGEPWEYVIETEEIVRNKYGFATIIDNEIATEKKVYRIR